MAGTVVRIRDFHPKPRPREPRDKPATIILLPDTVTQPSQPSPLSGFTLDEGELVPTHPVILV